MRDFKLFVYRECLLVLKKLLVDLYADESDEETAYLNDEVIEGIEEVCRNLNSRFLEIKFSK